MPNREDIGKVRKVNISNNPEYTLFEIQYCYKSDSETNPDWYDLFEDPPEWLCDIILDILNDKEK